MSSGIDPNAAFSFKEVFSYVGGIALAYTGWLHTKLERHAEKIQQGRDDLQDAKLKAKDLYVGIDHFKELKEEMLRRHDRTDAKIDQLYAAVTGCENCTPRK